MDWFVDALWSVGVGAGVFVLAFTGGMLIGSLYWAADAGVRALAASIRAHRSER